MRLSSYPINTLRDVPVRWLRTVSQVFVQLDRVVDLERVVTQAQLRMVTTGVDSVSTRQLGLTEGEGTATGRLLMQTFERQGLRVMQSKQEATLKLTPSTAFTTPPNVWKCVLRSRTSRSASPMVAVSFVISAAD